MASHRYDYQYDGERLQISTSDTDPVHTVRDAVDKLIDLARLNSRYLDNVTFQIQYFEPGDSTEEKLVVRGNVVQCDPAVSLEEMLSVERYPRVDDLHSYEPWAAGATLVGDFESPGVRFSSIGDSVRVGSHQPDGGGTEIVVHPAGSADDGRFVVDRHETSEIESGWAQIVITNLKNGLRPLVRSAVEEMTSSLQDEFIDRLAELSTNLGEHVEKQGVEEALTTEIMDERGVEETLWRYLEEDLDDANLYAVDDDVLSRIDNKGVNPRLLKEQALQPLSGALGRTYCRLLAGGIDTSEGQSIDFDMTVSYHGADGTQAELAVEPVTPPSCVHLPTDGLVPRVYENVPFALSSDADEEDMCADVEIGLQEEADPDTAGLYVSFRDRMIHFADTESKLFTSEYLGQLTHSRGETRLVVKVVLKGPVTEQENVFPIAGSKADFDYDNPIADRLLDFIAKVARPYKSQTTSRLPSWFLRAFGSDTPQLDPERRPDKISQDKSGSAVNRTAAKPQPGFYRTGKRLRGYPERDILRTIVRMHHLLRIRVDDPARYLREQFGKLIDYTVDNRECDDEDSDTLLCNLEPLSNERSKQLAALYDYYMDNEYAVEPLFRSSPVRVSAEEGSDVTAWEYLLDEKDPDEIVDLPGNNANYYPFVSGNVPALLRQIRTMAAIHVGQSGRADGTHLIPGWLRTRYREELWHASVARILGHADTYERFLKHPEASAPGEEYRYEYDIESLRRLHESATVYDSGHGKSVKAVIIEPYLDLTFWDEDTVLDLTGVDDWPLSRNPETETAGNVDAPPSTHSSSGGSLPDIEGGFVDYEHVALMALEQSPPEQGMILLEDGEPMIVDTETFQQIRQKLGDLGYDEEDDLIDAIVAALERLNELEQAAALFRGE